MDRGEILELEGDFTEHAVYGSQFKNGIAVPVVTINNVCYKSFQLCHCFPVSYTHLDVYKRQTLITGSNPVRAS